MQIRLIRSATLSVDLAGVRLLIDPWLAAKGAGKSYSGRGLSPLVDLPTSVDELLEGIDAVLVSHLHSDHFDEAAQRLLPKSMPILCHSRDRQSIVAMGFKDVRAIGEGLDLGSVHIRATDGQHGPPEVLDDMGEVSGFLMNAPGEPLLYWAGDTILCPRSRRSSRRNARKSWWFMDAEPFGTARDRSSWIEKWSWRHCVSPGTRPSSSRISMRSTTQPSLALTTTPSSRMGIS